MLFHFAFTASVLASEHNDDMSAWGWVMMALFATLFAGLLATGIWALVTYTKRNRSGRITPEELLAERLARGEITTEEYRERLDALRG